jgi:hypothetical protein
MDRWQSLLLGNAKKLAVFVFIGTARASEGGK